MYRRTETRQLRLGKLVLGGSDRVLIQSMTNSETKDIEATVAQCLELESLGCQAVRCAVPALEDAQALGAIRSRIHIPLIADIHFDYHLALAALESGVDAIRINPGNIGSADNVRKVVDGCRHYRVPIRIGINSGSLEKSELAKYGRVTAAGMIESAARHIRILEDLGFRDICLSFKSSDVPTTIEAYRMAARRWDYPLHLGITEAGSFFSSSIKSSCALGALLADGIGDTLRVSVTGAPAEEIKIAKRILKCFGLIADLPELISCPTCGRTQYDMLGIIPEIERFLDQVHCDITVAVMGCAVNGPGEAREADIGIAGGRDEALLFEKGQIIRKIPQDRIIPELEAEITKLVNEKKDS